MKIFTFIGLILRRFMWFWCLLCGSTCNERPVNNGSLIVLEVNPNSGRKNIQVSELVFSSNDEDCIRENKISTIELSKSLPFEILRSSEIGSKGEYFWIGQSCFIDLKKNENVDILNIDFFQRSFISTFNPGMKFIELESYDSVRFKLYSAYNLGAQIADGSIEDSGIRVENGQIPLEMQHIAYLKYDENDSRILCGLDLKNSLAPFIIDSISYTSSDSLVGTVLPRSIYWESDSVLSYITGYFEDNFYELEKISINSFDFYTRERRTLIETSWPPIKWADETSYLTHQILPNGFLIFIDQGIIFIDSLGKKSCVHRLDVNHKLIAGKLIE